MYAQLRRRLDHKDDSGFTLIELLMVIVILAVLAAVVVFSVGGLSDTSKASACKSELSTVNTAAESYYAQDRGATPATSVSALITAGVLHDDADIDAGGPTGAVTAFESNGYQFQWIDGGKAAPDGSTAGNAGELVVVTGLTIAGTGVTGTAKAATC